MSSPSPRGQSERQFTEADRAFMQRALNLAAKGLGYCSPNPAVGAVVVRNHHIVGEGYHRQAGAAHAEVEALQRAGIAAQGSSLYVTLEPCNHQGRTPPCTEAILQAGVAEVFYAAADPNPRVAGGGAQRLLDAGIQVHHGPLIEPATKLNRFFFHHITMGRPYVVAKFAASLDGKIATRAGDSQWITGVPARRYGHRLRHLCDAILVGAGTVIADDPRLTTRLPDVPKPRQPLRVVLDSRGRAPLTAQLFNPELPGQTVVATTAAMDSAHRSRLTQQGVDVWLVPATRAGKVDLVALLDRLGQQNVTSLLVEGGGEVLGSFFAANLVDEVCALLAPIIIGGNGAPGAVRGLGVARLEEALRLNDVEVETVGEDILIRGTAQKDAKVTLFQAEHVEER